MESSSSEINRLCECGICHEGLQDAHICPECSNPFCRKCITQWLGRHRDCPVCRKQMICQKLVKARIYEQVLEYVNRPPAVNEASVKQLNCGKHRDKQLSLFCWTCLECACVTCLFSKAHAKHKEQVVLFESASKKLKTRISGELGWIISRDQEIAQAIALHVDNVTKLSTEKNRIFANIQHVLDAVKGQYDRECAKQQDKINLLEADKKTNSELRRTAEEWIKSDKIFELLPKIASLLKLDRFNSTVTKPKPVEKVNPCFKNDLTPDQIEFTLPVDGRATSQIFKIECGFEFKVQLNPDRTSSLYTVALTIEKGIGGVYPVALGNNPLAPMNFGLHKAMTLGQVAAAAAPLVTIKVQLAKTYAEKCLLHQRYIHQLEEVVNSLKVSSQEQVATIESLTGTCNDQEARLVHERNKIKTLCQNLQEAIDSLENRSSKLSESLRLKNCQLQQNERLLHAKREENSALRSQLLEKTHAFDALEHEANKEISALRDQLQKRAHDFEVFEFSGLGIAIIFLILYVLK